MSNAATTRLQNDLNRGRVSIYDTEGAKVLNSNRYRGADIEGVQRIYFENNLSAENLTAYQEGGFDPLRDTRSEIYNPQSALDTFGEEVFKANDPDADLFLTDPNAYSRKVAQTAQSEASLPLSQRTRPLDQFAVANLKASQTGKFVPFPDGTAGGYTPNGAVITVEPTGVVKLLNPDGSSVNETFTSLDNAINYVNTEQTNPETGAYITRIERSLQQAQTGKPDFAYLNQDEIQQVVNQSDRYTGGNQGIANQIKDFGLGSVQGQRTNQAINNALGLISQELGSNTARYLKGNPSAGVPDNSNVVTDYIKTNFPDLYDPYEAYRVTRNGETFGLSDEEIKFIDQSKTLGYNDEEINTFLDKRFANRTPVTEDTDFDTSAAMQDLAITEEPKPEDTSVGSDGITTENEINIEPIETPVQETVTDNLEQTQPSTISTYQPSSTSQIQTMPIASSTTYTQPATQPQFTGPVNPTTGTYQLPQSMTFAPSNVQFGPPQISTGVVGQASSFGYTPTIPIQSSYMPNFQYQQGGMVPNMQQQNQQTMPMTQSFGGFKPQAMQKIAGSLGYQGDMSGFNDYLNNNPDKKQKMDMYNQKAMQMAKGGMVQKFQSGGSPDPTPVSQQYIPPQTLPESGSLEDVFALQAVTPGLPVGATVVPVKTTMEAGQFIDPRSGQVSGASALPTALAGTTQAGMPVATGTTLAGTTTVAGAVADVAEGTQAAQGTVSDQAQVGAAQQTESSVTGLEAAQGTATLIDNPVTREIQEGELVTGAADAEKAAKFTEQIQAAEATPSEKATVQGQLEGLMQDFEGGATPAWASGAIRAVSAQMAARGLGASSIAGQALVQAAMESALPIAQADASVTASFEQQNLSNRQQRAMLAAQQRAQFIGQEFDQAFQARVANAAKVSDVANMNFTAEQQIALENARITNSVDLANLSNSQAMVMAEAAALANLDMANLSNRQQAAVQNAQNFLQMDMANLSNKQQTELFQAQQRIQSLFTDQAAINAAAQFNASSQNQTDQFFASLANQTAQFNASQANAQAQFNAGQTNVVERFNTEINNQREQFNATNRLVIDQANATWRRQIATAATEATNRANEINAESLLGVSRDAYNNLWQYYSDNMEWAWTASENEKTRLVNIATAQLRSETELDLQTIKNDYSSSIGFGSLIGKKLTSDLTNTLGGTILGDVFDFDLFG